VFEESISSANIYSLLLIYEYGSVQPWSSQTDFNILHFASAKCTMHSMNSVCLATLTVHISNNLLHFWGKSSSSASGGQWLIGPSERAGGHGGRKADGSEGATVSAAASTNRRPWRRASRWLMGPRRPRQQAGGGNNGWASRRLRTSDRLGGGINGHVDEQRPRRRAASTDGQRSRCGG
jgi:hypothetical protein